MKKVDSLRQIVKGEIGTDPSNRISQKRHREETPPGIKILHVGGEFTQAHHHTGEDSRRSCLEISGRYDISAHLLAPYIRHQHLSLKG
jgi:hypothetical protein